MTYEKALQQSPCIEGAIKCTYTRFYYDYGGKGRRDDMQHLFSLQYDEKQGEKNGIPGSMPSFNSIVDTVKDIIGEVPCVPGSVQNPYGQYSVITHGHDLTIQTEGGAMRYPIVEVRPSFRKEIDSEDHLVRVHIEEPVLNSLAYFIEKYYKKIGHVNFSYVTDKILDVRNLYVKRCAVDWQPMSGDLLDEVLAEEDLHKAKEQMEKSKKLLLLAAATALLLNQ